MVYTVNRLSKLAGVSVATLHYYDEIGLLKPSYLKENGYRCYEKKQLLKLQQILFFRELEFSLAQIKTMVNNPKFNTIEALKDQRKLLVMKKNRLNGLLKTIDKTVNNLEGGETMNDDQLYGSFTKQQMEEYKEEARKKWGDEAVRASEERIRDWTKADWATIQQENDALMRSIVANMDKGVASPEVQKDIDSYFIGMQKFGTYTYEMFRGLGQMYVEDKRFTAFYDKYHPSLATFMCDAMAHYADTHQQK